MRLKFNFNIPQRIAAGYFIIIFIAVIASVAIILTFESNKSKYSEISDKYLPSVSNLKELKILVNDSKKLVKDFVLNYKIDVEEQLRTIHEKTYPELKKSLQSLTSNKQMENENEITSILSRFDSVVMMQKHVMQALSTPEQRSSDSLIDIQNDFFEQKIGPSVKALNSDLDRTLAHQNELLKSNEGKLRASYDYLTYVMVALLVIILIVGYYASKLATRSISKPLNELKNSIVQLGRGEIPEINAISRNDEIGEMTNAVASMKDSIRLKTDFASETGKGNYDKKFDLLSDKDILGLALIEMNENLKENALEEKSRSWMNDGVSRLNEILRTKQDKRNELYNDTVSFLVNYLPANIGGLFVTDDSNAERKRLRLVSGYAFDRNLTEKISISFGEGITGQSALEKKRLLMDNLPDDFMKISSGFGESKPRQLIVLPLMFETEVKGVMEFASFSTFSAQQIEFLETCSRIIASSLDLISRKEKTEKLLKESQELNARLQAQEEELKVSNEELMEKTNLLQVSEEELKVQQEELMQTNTQLEEKAQLLAQQNEAIRVKNEELEEAREAIRIKAEELELTSKYKSEFLANMSHELRTPLNSILILANLLAENKEKNLSDKQAEYARVINKSGSDLLELINDILDLSKIESRKIELDVTDFPFTVLAYDIDSLFKELARNKKINFSVNLNKDLPPHFTCDKLRMEQIIKNLLSNAFKFTPADGSIVLNIFKAPANAKYMNDNLAKSSENIFFEVKDSGIGIPEEKQQIIFEAFQQADGSTSRKYGGTGLGLSISRELAFMLGGEIHVSSSPGQGSAFTLILPNNFLKKEAQAEETPSQHSAPKPKPPVERAAPKTVATTVEPNGTESRTEMLVLIIEDDKPFANVLLQQAEEKGFKGMVADRGDTGLEMAEKHKPDAIILDINLPVMDGWAVMRKLKANEALKDIPVHILSGNENEKLGMQLGAVEFLRKPVSNEQLKNIFLKIKEENAQPFHRVLVIEDNPESNSSIVALLGSHSVDCSSAHNGDEALTLLSKNSYHLIILDLSLPDVSGFDLLQKIRNNPDLANIPIIVYTGKSLSVKENKMLSEYSNAVIIKTPKSSERLLDEATLFLKKVEKGSLTPAAGNNKTVPHMEEMLKGKKVLLVDDDMRNIFALTKFLERYELNIVVANDGKESLERLSENPDTNLVLMDIMMPEMDGYEAMQKIRAQTKFKDLPIIALTAKAMKGDREKCIEAGASDYVSKPIDTQQLVSLMRVWLSK